MTEENVAEVGCSAEEMSRDMRDEQRSARSKKGSSLTALSKGV